MLANICLIVYVLFPHSVVNLVQKGVTLNVFTSEISWMFKKDGEEAVRSFCPGGCLRFSQYLSITSSAICCLLRRSRGRFCSSKETVLKLLPRGRDQRHRYFRLALDYLEENGSVLLELETKLWFLCVKLDLFVCVGGEECCSRVHLRVLIVSEGNMGEVQQ